MAAATLDAETTAKVIRQMELYFSDDRLPKDSFMMQKIKESDDGLIDLRLLCTFPRMRLHLGVQELEPAKFPADKVAGVAEALRKSTYLRLSEDEKRVGRAIVMPKAEVDARSIAAHPFPSHLSVKQVQAVFTPHAQVHNVQFSKRKGVNLPAGYAVIEFLSKHEAEKVLELKLTCDGVALELELKTALDTRIDTLLEQEESQKVEEQALKQEEVEEEVKKGLIVSFTAKKIEEVKTTEGEDDGECNEVNLSREDIKMGLAKFGALKYVDYAKGKDSGFLRFAEPEDAQKLREAAALEPEGGMTIANHLMTFAALEGEAEEEYWKKVREGQGLKKRDSGFGGGRGRGGWRRGGKGRGRGGRGRRGSKRPSEGEGPKAKAQKTE